MSDLLSSFYEKPIIFLIVRLYFHYWQSYRVEKGAKMSGRNPFNWFFRFPARPCGFRASRNKKWSKFRLFLRFLALFERFFDSNTPVTTWLRMGPRNSIRGAHSQNFGTLYNPVALSIVIWIKSKLLLPQCYRTCGNRTQEFYLFLSPL